MLVGLLPREAHAEASIEDQTRARELFEQGVEAARAEDFGAAIEAFEESYALYPHPGTLLNLGLYQLQAGQRVDAYRTLRDPFLTLFGGYRLKGSNLLLHLGAFAIRTSEFSFLMFGHRHDK